MSTGGAEACAIMRPEASGLEDVDLASPSAAGAERGAGTHQGSGADGDDGEAAAHEERAVPVVMSARETWKRRLYMVAAVVVVATSIALGAKFGSHIFNAIIDAKDFLRNEPFSLLGYFSIFTMMSMFFVPYSPFSIAIGFIFGIYWGFVIEMCNIFISSSTIFFVGRYLFKDYVEALIVNSSEATANIWKGLMKYLGRDWREAAKMNILLCFIPMPYGMNRYLFALTNVKFTPYNIYFMIGMIPNTLLNLLIGAALSEASGEQGIDVFRLAGTCVAVTGMMMAIWYAKGVAQKVLEESNREDAEEGRAEEGRAGVVADGKVMISMSPAAAGLQVGGSLQLVVDDSAAKSEDLSTSSCADAESSNLNASPSSADPAVGQQPCPPASAAVAGESRATGHRRIQSWPRSWVGMTQVPSQPVEVAPQPAGLLLHRRVYSSIRSSLRGSPLSRYVQLDEERAGGSREASLDLERAGGSREAAEARAPVASAAPSARGLLDAKGTHAEALQVPCAEEALEAEAESVTESTEAEQGLLKGLGLMRSEGSADPTTSISRNSRGTHLRSHSWQGSWGIGPSSPTSSGAGLAQDRYASMV